MYPMSISHLIPLETWTLRLLLGSFIAPKQMRIVKNEHDMRKKYSKSAMGSRFMWSPTKNERNGYVSTPQAAREGALRLVDHQLYQWCSVDMVGKCFWWRDNTQSILDPYLIGSRLTFSDSDWLSHYIRKEHINSYPINSYIEYLYTYIYIIFTNYIPL